MECQIRPAREEDSADVSRVIIEALRITNIRSYSEAVISRVENSFSPTAVKALMAKRKVYIALAEGRIVGTASLDGCVVRTVFVSPDFHGKGVGRALMAVLEYDAREAHVEVLTVPSSITAEAFYAKLGFTAVRESFHGEERTIIMERKLS